MSDALVVLFCPTCGDERLAEIPPCPDGHGSDCPDRACVECGTALLLDAALFAAANARREDSDGGAHGSAPRDARTAQGA
jgi:hypothetical protein